MATPTQPSPRPNFQRAWRSAVLLLLAAVVITTETGCVRRRLTVRTNPPGAQVFVDNREIGTSPASTSFVYYGTREITVIKDGYETQKIFQPFFPPWYEIPPLDFISETIYPFEQRDERVVDVEMVPMQNIPEAQLLDRADALRLGASAGQVTPLPNAVPGFGVPPAPLPQTLPGLPGQGIGPQPAPGPVPAPPPSYPAGTPLLQPSPTTPGLLTAPGR